MRRRLRHAIGCYAATLVAGCAFVGGLEGDFGPAPTCADRIKDGAETDLDCGGPCSPCALGQNCAAKGDCATGACVGGKCAAANCSDKLKNGSETDIDCGGMCGKCQED